MCYNTVYFILKPKNPAISHLKKVIPMKRKSPDSSQTSFLTVSSVFGLQAYY